MIKLNTSHLRGDLYGGLTAGVVALPLALAMGGRIRAWSYRRFIRRNFCWFFCCTIWWNRITDIRPYWSNDRRCRWARSQYRSAPGSGW